MRKKYLMTFLMTLIIISVFFLSVIFSNKEVKAEDKIVDVTVIYTYEMMMDDLRQLSEKYPELISYEIIGNSHFGRSIPAVKVGYGEANVFINGSHHAREWMTTMVNMKMIEDYADAYKQNSVIGQFHVKGILEKTSIWFVPMVNPDGVTLQQKGVGSFPQSVRTELYIMNDYNWDFSKWKADGRGIDLNRQYPADWENIKYNREYPSWKNHKGTQPFETVETAIVRDFVYEKNPEIATAYHSSGRVLYWTFHTEPENLERDRKLADIFSEITGYGLVFPGENPSGGGFTDWFIQEFDKPGFTPEISYYVGDTHVPLSVFPEVWRRNQTIGLWLAQEGNELWYLRNKDNIYQTEEYQKTIMLFENVNYYDGPSNSYRKLGIIEKGQINVTEKYNEWLIIEKENERVWIKPTHYTEGKIYPINKSVVFNKEIEFYELPHEVYKEDTIGPSTIDLTKKVGNWYSFNFNGGEKWIYDEDIYPYKLVLNDITEIYNEPDVQTYISSAKPTTVDVLSEYNQWLLINTWLGEKWIQNPEIVEKTMTLRELTKIYDKPDLNTQISLAKPTNIVSVYDEKGWYLVKTWLGEKWIQDPDSYPMTLTVSTLTDVYHEPNIKTYISTAKPTTLEVIDMKEGWYLVKTWLGNKWIQDPELFPRKIELLEITKIYHEPNIHTYVSSAKPTIVLAHRQKGDWVQIDTWLGKKWIKY